ncbi:unnamed protein product [Hymenolepis diminuta]|uniref:Uncharacterized protein n=1 Tax=Hymenolepis diminuta TaxID=6216 RepID=A0A564YSP3_HYMDI|nr:unnamed protein product [Hymenolepis diminuta]
METITSVNENNSVSVNDHPSEECDINEEEAIVKNGVKEGSSYTLDNCNPNFVVDESARNGDPRADATEEVQINGKVECAERGVGNGNSVLKCDEADNNSAPRRPSGVRLTFPDEIKIPRPSSPAIETTTPEVGCDRATLPGGVGVEGAVRADAQETPSPLASKAVGAKSKRGKGQQKNPTASKFKSEKIASAKFTLPSSFQLSRLLSSRSEPVETTAKFNHVNESKSIHKHISFEQLPPSTPVEPWIVRERLRIKAAKRRRMERQPVNDTWSVVCRNILLCFVLAAVVMLAYCFF